MTRHVGIKLNITDENRDNAAREEQSIRKEDRPAGLNKTK